VGSLTRLMKDLGPPAVSSTPPQSRLRAYLDGKAATT
jgi:hypothetical protein